MSTQGIRKMKVTVRQLPAKGTDAWHRRNLKLVAMLDLHAVPWEETPEGLLAKFGYMLNGEFDYDVVNISELPITVIRAMLGY